MLQDAVQQEEDTGCLYKIAVSHSLVDLCRCLSEFYLSPAHADTMSACTLLHLNNSHCSLLQLQVNGTLPLQLAKGYELFYFSFRPQLVWTVYTSLALELGLHKKKALQLQFFCLYGSHGLKKIAQHEARLGSKEGVSLAQPDPLPNASLRKGSGVERLVQMEFGGRV